MVADEHHEEDEEDDEECTVFQKEVGEEKEEMLDSRSNSSEQSLEEEQSEGESQPSLSFVTVKDDVRAVGRVVVEEEGEGVEVRLETLGISRVRFDEIPRRYCHELRRHNKRYRVGRKCLVAPALPNRNILEFSFSFLSHSFNSF